MITIYHRPQTLEEALRLISRPSPRTVPLGGGTLLSHGATEALEVVDLQALGLASLTRQHLERRHQPDETDRSLASMTFTVLWNF